MADVEEVQGRTDAAGTVIKELPRQVFLKDFAGKKQCKPMKESQCSLPGVKGI